MARLLRYVHFALLTLISAAFCSPVSADVILSYEFDSDEEGFTGNNISGLGALGGSLRGVATNTDPQLILAATQLPGGQAPTAGANWTTLQYRVRETNSSGGGFVSFANASNTTGLVFSSNLGQINGNTMGGLFSFSDAGGGFTDVTVDISSYGTGTLTNFRLDPIGGATGPVTTDNSFEVDFIRFSDSAAVPEPSSFAFLGLAAVGVAYRRRRYRQQQAEQDCQTV